MHLRMKIGEHEFECSGDTSMVLRKYDEWRAALRKHFDIHVGEAPTRRTGEVQDGR